LPTPEPMHGDLYGASQHLGLKKMIYSYMVTFDNDTKLINILTICMYYDNYHD